MNKPLLTLLLLVYFIAAKAQTNNTDAPDLNKTQVKKSVDTIPKPLFYAVEREPSFPGGPDVYVRFLQHNLKYPENAVKKRIEGKVFLSFVVEKDGSLTDITLLRGVSPDLDAEALRIIASSPKWKPGIQNGIPVRVKYNMAIVFKLQPQSTADSEQPQIDSLRNLPFDQKIFTAVEHQPSFPGGRQAFQNYVLNNLKYPEKAREDKIKGSVYISFIIDRDGSLTDFRLSKHLSPETDAEAIRLMEECPKWNPGMQNGRTVRVAYTIPVTFKLSD